MWFCISKAPLSTSPPLFVVGVWSRVAGNHFKPALFVADIKDAILNVFDHEKSAHIQVLPPLYSHNPSLFNMRIFEVWCIQSYVACVVRSQNSAALMIWICGKSHVTSWKKKGQKICRTPKRQKMLSVQTPPWALADPVGHFSPAALIVQSFCLLTGARCCAFVGAARRGASLVKPLPRPPPLRCSRGWLAVKLLCRGIGVVTGLLITTGGTLHSCWWWQLLEMVPWSPVLKLASSEN